MLNFVIYRAPPQSLVSVVFHSVSMRSNGYCTCSFTVPMSTNHQNPREIYRTSTENHWELRKNCGNPMRLLKNHRKTAENYGKIVENYGTTMEKLWETTEKLWETTENYGNYGIPLHSFSVVSWKLRRNYGETTDGNSIVSIVSP